MRHMVKKPCIEKTHGEMSNTYIISPEGKIKTHWKKVKINKGHVQEILKYYGLVI